jgi:hypothetical protein
LRAAAEAAEPLLVRWFTLLALLASDKADIQLDRFSFLKAAHVRVFFSAGRWLICVNVEIAEYSDACREGRIERVKFVTTGITTGVRRVG